MESEKWCWKETSRRLSSNLWLSQVTIILSNQIWNPSKSGDTATFLGTCSSAAFLPCWIKEVIPEVQSEPTKFQLVATAPCYITSYYWEVMGSIIFVTTFQILVENNIGYKLDIMQVPGTW